MKFQNKVIIWLTVIYHIRYFRRSLCAVEDFPWLNADKLIKAVCPNTQICELTERIGSIQNTCCEACTCREDHLIKNQCFLKTSEEYETCIYPITKPHIKFIQISKRLRFDSYLMVTKNPTNGCSSGKTPSCDTDDIANFAPVFSTETNKSYYNSNCARRHGIKTYEKWDSVLMCDEFINGSTLNFEKELQTFLENPSSSLCFIQFTPQHYFRPAKCTLHTEQSLESLFHDITVRKDKNAEETFYGMSVNDIVDACMSHFYAPVFDEIRQKWYPNAFCYIYANKEEQEAMCQMISTYADIDYMTLLNQNAITYLQARKKELPTLDLVCLEEQYYNKKSKVCRPLNCPLGCVLNKDKECTFIGPKLLLNGFTRYSIHILIRSTNNSQDDRPRLIDIPVSNITEAMELPDDMKLLFIANRTDPFGNKLNQTNELLIGFFFVNKEMGLRYVKQNLNSTILLSDGTSSNYFTQKLFALPLNLTTFKQKRVSELLSTVQCPTKKWKGEVSIQQNLDFFLSSCWQIRVYNKVALESIMLSKLYACNLVKLMPGEFELFGNDYVLYNKMTQTYLLEKEFVAWQNEDGEKVAKVCLEDSGFEFRAMTDSASVNFNGHLFITIIYPIKRLAWKSFLDV